MSLFHRPLSLSCPITIAQVSVQVKKQAQQESEHFEGPVLEYGRMTTALKTALHKRNEKKITYMTAAHDLEAKRAHHSKVSGLSGDRQVSEPTGYSSAKCVGLWR